MPSVLPSVLPSVRFRRAVPTDAATLAAFMARTFRETYGPEHGGVCRPADVEAYASAHFAEPIQRGELADPALTTLIAEIDQSIAGYAQLRVGGPAPAVPGPRPVELARFYVDRPWHGRGLAGALMRECLATVPDAEPLWLGVYERNPRAIAFYTKWGFVPGGRTRFTMGDDVQDDWVLVRAPATPIPSTPPLR